MNKKGISTITFVITAAVMFILIGVFAMNISTKDTPKQQFMVALQNSTADIVTNVLEREPVLKSVEAKLKSGIEIKETVNTKQTNFVNYLNNHIITADVRYLLGTDKSSFKIVDDSVNSENALRIYGETKDGQAVINIGGVMHEDANVYSLEGIEEFLLTNIKLYDARKISALKSAYESLSEVIDAKDISAERGTIKVDEVTKEVEKITLSLSSEKLKSTLMNFVANIKADKKYVMAVDELIGKDITDSNNAISLLTKLESAIDEVSEDYDSISISFAKDETGKVVNATITAISKNDAVKSKRININKIPTNEQKYSITYLEDLDLVAGFNCYEKDGVEEFTATYGNYELKAIIENKDYSNIEYMLTNIKNNQKVSGKVTSQNINKDVQASITAAGMIEDSVINAVLAVNFKLNTATQLDNAIDMFKPCN